jgi:hypothetical protein
MYAYIHICMHTYNMKPLCANCGYTNSCVEDYVSNAHISLRWCHQAMFTTFGRKTRWCKMISAKYYISCANMYSHEYIFTYTAHFGTRSQLWNMLLSLLRASMTFLRRLAARGDQLLRLWVRPCMHVDMRCVQHIYCVWLYVTPLRQICGKWISAMGTASVRIDCTWDV